MVQGLYDFKSVLESLSENEAKQWIVKVYKSLLETSGLKDSVSSRR